MAAVLPSPCSLSMLFIVQFSVVWSTSLPFTRKLSSSFLCPEENYTNSGDCPRVIGGEGYDNTMLNFIHTKAIGENDTIHYIISSYGVPSILMAKTGNDAELNVNWAEYLSKDVKDVANSISFSQEPQYVSTLLLNNLIEYDDLNDTASVSDQTGHQTVHIIELSESSWLNCSDSSNLTSHKFKLQFKPDTGYQNATFSLMIELFGNEGRNAELPHLEYSANISHITVTMDSLPTEFNQSRFALELLLITTDENHNLTKVESYRSLDDEHSPGVFTMTDWTSQGDKQTDGTFLQWKPISYTGRTRNLTVATKAVNGHLSPVHFHQSTLKHSVALGYFGTKLYNDTLLIYGTNMSFGLPEDKFYVGYNYTLWTFSMGFGPPPSDEVSLLIILIISIGLGIPVVLIIVGGLGVCIKKQKDKNKGYQNIPNEYSTIQ